MQLQQVVLNLLMNGIEAMSAIADRPRELVIKTQKNEVDKVRVTVQDSGIGLDLQSMKRGFLGPFTRPSPRGWGWGYRSAARL